MRSGLTTHDLLTLVFLCETLLTLLFFPFLSLKSDGQLEEWCIADEQTPYEVLQEALDWACGNGVNCAQINHIDQPCYLPNTVKDHASYAFNSYYQEFKHKNGSCYFNSAALVTGQDPIKDITRPLDIKLHSDIRAVDLADLDHQVAEKMSLIEQYKMERERQLKVKKKQREVMGPWY